MESDQNLSPSKSPLPRIAVEKMEAYKAPLEGRREHLRLDFNENTIGPSPLVLDALRKIPRDYISIYPEYNGLKEAIAANLNKLNIEIPIRPSQIEIFNGVDGAIHSTFHAYGDKDDRLLTTTPTFGYYTPCAHMQGMEIIQIPYEGSNFAYPLIRIRESLLKQSPKILVICNPNNPTGTILEASEILKLASLAPETLLVIDELYEAFSGQSVLKSIDFTNTPNVLVLRSLSKTAGLAGLRIGFAIGNAKIVSRVNRVQGPYDINSFAVTAALAAIKDQQYIDNYVAEVLNAKEWIKKKLIDNKVKHHIDGGNYFLIWPQKGPTYIESALKKEGILVRNMDKKTLLEGSLRVSIGIKSQMERFWSIFIKHEVN